MTEFNSPKYLKYDYAMSLRISTQIMYISLLKD